jgi:hypothetical protein
VSIDYELRHGYTLRDLDRVARLATHVGPMAGNYHDRRDEAWSAIVEHLYSTDQWLPEHDLVWIGRKAIYDSVTADRRERGYYRLHTDGTQHGPGSSPAFATYWWDMFARPTGSPEPGIVERISVWQILPTLTPGQAEVIFALAAHDDYQSAAAALGMTTVGFRSQVCQARRRFLELWHEGEQPSKPWGQDRRAGQTAGTRRQGGTAMDAISRRARAQRRRSEEVA